MTEVESFGMRLRRLRQQAGYQRQIDFARAIHVTNAAVSMWETGQRHPIRGLLPRIAKTLHVSEPYLRYGIRTATDVLSQLSR